MACPTCGHTMQNVGGTDHRVYWCNRCGTLLEKGPNEWERKEAPMLVERCREFEQHASEAATVLQVVRMWHRLGITESINTPGDRPA